MPDRKRRRPSSDRVQPEVEARQEATTVKVYRTYSESGSIMSEDEGKEDLDAKVFLTNPAYVSVDHGSTRNLGDFNSMKVSVRVSVPCYPNEIDEALLYADKTAADFLADTLDQYSDELK